jgi:hypothetical protein
MVPAPNKLQAAWPLQASTFLFNLSGLKHHVFYMLRDVRSYYCEEGKVGHNHASLSSSQYVLISNSPMETAKTPYSSAAQQLQSCCAYTRCIPHAIECRAASMLPAVAVAGASVDAADVVAQSFLGELPVLATEPALLKVPALSLVPVLVVLLCDRLLVIAVLPAVGWDYYIRSFQP